MPHTPQQFPLGDIEFFDNILPSLLDGDYTITTTPKLSGVSSIPSDALLCKKQKFSIQGARFKIDSTAAIQSMYPPDKSSGKFESKLPHIVLTKRTFPWERKLESTSQNGVPWVALLLFDEEELITNSGHNLGPTKAITLPLSDIRNVQANGILGPVIPKLDFGQTDDMVCQAIDISTQTFKTIVPHIEELAYLSHCRQVNVGDKTIMDIPHSGWFSVVVGSRFPIQNPTTPKKQVCHLVSLEGFSDYLGTQPNFPKGIETIRLISLASWSFTCLPERGESFRELMLNLVNEKSVSETNLLFKLPQASISNPTPEQKLVQEAIDCGYIPITYQSRPGDQTFAWYRGPFSPVLSTRFTENTPPFLSGSEAIIYDKNTATFNLSYAIAWQAGRSLALADKTFGINLLNWRRQANRLVDLCIARFTNDGYASLINSDKNPQNIEAIHTWLHGELISDTFLNYILSDFSEKIAPKISSAYSPVKSSNRQKEKPFPNPSFDAGTLPNSLIDEFKKFLTQENVLAILNTIATDELVAITEWLASLYLLDGVPVNTLIPDSELLPTESIRFFYLDRAWLDSLVDGAMSVGIHTSKESLYYKFTKDIIRKGVELTILEVREKLLGLPISPKDPTKGELSGFILRSQAVQNWPGLEVKAYKTVSSRNNVLTPSDPIPLLRMQRLSPALLLCLFPDIPAWVELNEPKEGLCFGVEDGEKIGIRKISDGSLSGVNYSIQPTDYRQNSDNRVLNITELQLHLSKQEGMPAPFTSADFALQMVCVPEQMVFQNIKAKNKR